jgi:hypothetical protein
VGPDGKANGTSPPDVQWSSLAPMTCAQAAAPREGPGVSFDLVIGGLVAHVTDRSGVDSQCQYQADFFSRAFFLPANSTVDLRIVPAIPEFREWAVTVTCDNDTVTNTTTFF